MKNSDELILSIDAGTQSIRAVLIDLFGNIVEIVKTNIEPYFSEQAGWAEQEPDYYWQKLTETTQSLFKQTKIDISCFSYSKNRYLSKAEKLLSKSDGKYSDDEIINKISTNPKNFKKEISGNFVKGENIISDKVLNLVKEGKIIENQRIVKLPKEKKIIYIRNISKASSKPFNEIKGIIIADYQDYLEQKWITKLKKKYKIKINKEILDVIKRKMKK